MDLISSNYAITLSFDRASSMVGCV